MIHSRRGLSDIVTNVLIILLVLVAVGIVWYFVQPFIRGSAGSIEGSQDCFTLDVAPISCTAAGAGLYDVVINRNSGSGALQGVKLVFTDAGGSTKVVDGTLSAGELNEFESKSFSAVDLGTFTPDNLKVAAVVALPSDVNGKTCDIRPATVNCA